MNKIDNRDLLKTVLFVLWKHRVKIFGSFLFVVAVSFALLMVWPPTFSATAKILVRDGRDRIPMAAVENRDTSFRTKEEVINSEAEILRGRYLHNKVIEKLGPDVFRLPPSTPRTFPGKVRAVVRRWVAGGVSWLKDLLVRAGLVDPLSPFQEAVLAVETGLRVSPVRKADVIELTFSSRNPVAAAEVLNTTVALYLERHNEVRQTQGAYQFLREQASLLERQMRQSENRLYDFRSRKGLVSVDEQKRILLNSVSESTRGLERVQREIAEVTARIQQQKTAVGGLKESVKVSEVRQRNPALDSLEARAVELQIQKEKLMGRFEPDSRAVQDLEREIARVRDLKEKTQADQVNSVTSGENLTYKELEKALLADEARLTALRAGEVSWNRDLLDYRKQLDRLASEEAALNRLTRDAAEKQSDYQVYRKGLEEQRIEAQMDRERIVRVSVIEPATVPIRPSRPRKLAILLTAAFMGLILGCSLAVLSESYDATFWREEDLERAFDVPVLGSIHDATGPMRK